MSTSVSQSSLRLAVFASTRGTDLQAILDEKKAGNLPWLDLRLLLSDRRDAYALVRAAEAGMPTVFLSAKGKTRSEYDAECLEVCRTAGIDLIFLIGYMRIVSPVLIEAYRGRIFNIHPSLLPKYPGMDMKVHEEVIRNGETESGCTLHHVNEDLDGGEIFLQEKVAVSPLETAESLKEKVQLAEQRTLLKALHQIAFQEKIISEYKSYKP
jgi:phosphoribosylglycinamide formyltransferase-1